VERVPELELARPGALAGPGWDDWSIWSQKKQSISISLHLLSLNYSL